MELQFTKNLTNLKDGDKVILQVLSDYAPDDLSYATIDAFLYKNGSFKHLKNTKWDGDSYISKKQINQFAVLPEYFDFENDNHLESVAVQLFINNIHYSTSTSIDEDSILAGYGNLDYDFQFPLPTNIIKSIFGTTSWRVHLNNTSDQAIQSLNVKCACSNELIPNISSVVGIDQESILQVLNAFFDESRKLFIRKELISE